MVGVQSVYLLGEEKSSYSSSTFTSRGTHGNCPICPKSANNNRCRRHFEVVFFFVLFFFAFGGGGGGGVSEKIRLDISCELSAR